MNFLQSEPGAEPVIVEGIFNVPPERLFRAWTEPEEIVKWFGIRPHSVATAEIDLRVGGRWRFVLEEGGERSAQLEGAYLTIEPDRKLVFSWAYVVRFPDGRTEETAHSQVAVTFTPHGRATRVHLTHRSIEAAEGRIGVGRGWESSFASLRDITGGGT